MASLVQFAQIVVSIGLILIILSQSKGVGLGRAWAGGGDFYKSRRGVEVVVFRLTIFLSIIFLALSILGLFVSSK